MKKAVFLLLVLVILVGCAGPKTTGKGMVEDPGSPEKTALLRERANDFWNAMVNADYEKIYSLYDPFYRARHSDVSEAMATIKGKIRYHKFEVKDIQVEGNVAKVKVSLVYSLPPVKMKLQVFSAPETPADLEETWLYVYDNWYKEFYSASHEKGYAVY
jgi:hypothetical protein